jgi:hypothetical protein
MTKDPFNDFKLSDDGTKLYRGVCIHCGDEFYHKNPYAKSCQNKERHKEEARRRAEQRRWKTVAREVRSRIDSADWSGGADNNARAYEDNQ